MGGRHRLGRRGEAAPVTPPGSERPTAVADPERDELVEPDRGAEGTVSPQERDARVSTHTERDPEEDIHLAASDPRQADRDR